MTARKLTLNSIHVHRQFQLREAEFAQETVDSIVAEGFNPAKFDPIPVFRDRGKWYVAGDGHSRLAALKALVAAGKPVPLLIPVRMVRFNDILSLAYTANMSRTPFTPCEEAAIFKRRIDAGDTIDRIASTSNRSAAYVRDRLLLNLLAASIRPLVGKAEYGLTIGQAVTFARACDRYKIDHAQQQAIWTSVVSKGDFTPKMLELALKGMSASATESSSDGMMFELPANLGATVAELNKVGDEIMAACRALRAAQRHVHLFKCPVLTKALNGTTTAEIERLERLLERKYQMLGQAHDQTRNVSRRAVTRTGQLDRALSILEGAAA